MGFRFILLITAIVVIWLILRSQWRKHKKKPSPAKKTAPFNSMVECHFCNIHIPEKEAIKKANYFYCSQDHANKANDSEND
jgi:uncharacterized protein